MLVVDARDFGLGRLLVVEADVLDPGLCATESMPKERRVSTPVSVFD